MLLCIANRGAEPKLLWRPIAIAPSITAATDVVWRTARLGRTAMNKQNSLAGRISRRTLMKNSVGAGAALTSTLAARHVLAQATGPIRIGNINSYTGGLAYAGENNLNGMNLYFDSIN